MNTKSKAESDTGTTRWDLRSQEPAAMRQEDGENDVRIREPGRNRKESKLQVTVRRELQVKKERKERHKPEPERKEPKARNWEAGACEPEPINTLMKNFFFIKLPVGGSKYSVGFSSAAARSRRRFLSKTMASRTKRSLL